MLTLTILALLAGGLMIRTLLADAKPEPKLVPIRIREERRPRR
jgi:hypothetical protein